MSLEDGDRPKLRNVELFPATVQGIQAIGIRDPLQVTERELYIRREWIFLLSMLDGSHSLRDIQLELSRQFGQLVFMDKIRELLAQLDEAYLLEGERFAEALEKRLAAYRSHRFRPCSHMGTCYSADPETLCCELESYFTGDGGPGMPSFFSDPRRPQGLIAPHIDIRLGARSFARAYHHLATGQPSDIYVILGTGHKGVQGLFTATTLDFQTPLGTVTTDRDFLAVLESHLGKDPSAEELLHATEHVIEFQVLFLQFMLSSRHDFTIVPILCWLPHHLFVEDHAFARERSQFYDFCRALKDACRSQSKSVCFIASADLDHIGPRYGDAFVPHAGTTSETLRKDSELLSLLERLDTDAFVREVARENDARRICGFSPIATMFHAIEPTEGRMLDLDYATVDDKQSFVSFASMIFH
jgi:MEMO1 family protein